MKYFLYILIALSMMQTNLCMLKNNAQQQNETIHLIKELKLQEKSTLEKLVTLVKARQKNQINSKQLTTLLQATGLYAVFLDNLENLGCSGAFASYHPFNADYSSKYRDFIYTYLLLPFFDPEQKINGDDLSYYYSIKNDVPWIKDLAKHAILEPDNTKLIQETHDKIQNMILKTDKKSIFLPYIKAYLEIFPGGKRKNSAYTKQNLRTPIELFEKLEVEELEIQAEENEWSNEKLKKETAKKKAMIKHMEKKS